MKTLLSDIIRTSRDIVDEYKLSKSFKSLKKRKAIRRREELLKDIDKLTKDKTCIPIEIIVEYGNLLADNFKPFGQYAHCRRVVKSGESVIMVFEFNLTEDDVAVVSIHPMNIDGSVALINYAYLKNKIPLFSFTDTNITILKSDNDAIILSNAESQDDYISERSTMVRNFTSKCIIEDITNYLKSMIYEEEI